MATLTINGKQHSVDVPDDTPILWTLRDVVGMTGTKFGCGMALCGACTVHLDGAPIRSCVTPVSSAIGKQITTIEGIGADAVGKRVQDAWVAIGVPQCGYCQAGQIMSATALLKTTPAPSDADIDSAMSGNICRCGTYTRIRAAIKHAAGKKATADANAPADAKIAAGRAGTDTTALSAQASAPSIEDRALALAQPSHHNGGIVQ